MTAPAYPHAHLANVGSASYQAQWLSNVIAAVKKYGYDGVFIDSVLGDHHHLVGRRPPDPLPQRRRLGRRDAGASSPPTGPS